MIILSPGHPKLKALVLEAYLLQEQELQGSEGTTCGDGSEMVVSDESLRDYGQTRFRLIVRKGVGNMTNAFMLTCHCSMFGWATVKEDALAELKSVFGNEAVESCANCDVDGGYDFSITIDTSKLPSGQTGESFADLLSRVRTLAIGSPLRSAFRNLALTSSEVAAADIDSAPHTVNIDRPTSRGQGGCCHIVCRPDRVTVVFPVDFEDETDSALSRLYLQNFVEAQRKASTKTDTPLCDFRRGNNPPSEVTSVYENGATDDIAGFLSFTFLSSHVASEAKCERAVELLVSFLTYMDYHVKASKTHMHTRMRQKKDALLGVLHDKPPK